MKIYILDASIIIRFIISNNKLKIKFFEHLLGEVKQGKATLYSSHLLPFEIGNGLRFSLKDTTRARLAFTTFMRLPIHYFVFNCVQTEKILQQSYDLQTSFYDTSYHFLAKIFQGIFLTADKKYFDKAKNEGFIQFV